MDVQIDPIVDEARRRIGQPDAEDGRFTPVVFAGRDGQWLLTVTHPGGVDAGEGARLLGLAVPATRADRVLYLADTRVTLDGAQPTDALAVLVLDRVDAGSWSASLALHAYERRPGAEAVWGERVDLPDGSALFGAVCDGLTATADRSDYATRLAALQRLHERGCAVEVSAAFDDEVVALLDARGD